MADDPTGRSSLRVALTVLDPDPVRAEARYQELRRDLIRYLEWGGCVDPDDVADEALYRGLKRLAEGVDTSQSSPRAYIFGVAKLVAKESVRRRTREAPLNADVWDRPSSSRGHAGVEAGLMVKHALRQLRPSDRSIILRYCAEDDHGAHCRDLGVSAGNLRLMVHRIRNAIRKEMQPGRREPPLSPVGRGGPATGD